MGEFPAIRIVQVKVGFSLFSSCCRLQYAWCVMACSESDRSWLDECVGASSGNGAQRRRHQVHPYVRVLPGHQRRAGFIDGLHTHATAFGK
jgi:hypothetical protein